MKSFTNKNSSVNINCYGLDVNTEHIDFNIYGADKDLNQTQKLYSFTIWNENYY